MMNSFIITGRIQGVKTTEKNGFFFKLETKQGNESKAYFPMGMYFPKGAQVTPPVEGALACITGKVVAKLKDGKATPMYLDAEHIGYISEECSENTVLLEGTLAAKPLMRKDGKSASLLVRLFSHKKGTDVICDYLRVACFGEQAVQAAQSAEKGDRVFISGARLARSRTGMQDEKGHNLYQNSIITENLMVLKDVPSQFATESIEVADGIPFTGYDLDMNAY